MNALLTASVLNVATPATAFTVAVPPSTAPAVVELPSAIVTAPVKPVATLPLAVLRGHDDRGERRARRGGRRAAT